MDNSFEKNETSSNKRTISKKLNALWADKRPFKKRLLLAGAAMLAACYTFIFFGPLELVAFSGDSLMYSYKDVIWVLLLGMIAVLAAGTLLLSALRGRIFNYAVSIVFALTLGGYLQSLMLNGGLGALTGDAIDWSVMGAQYVWALLIWGLIFAFVFFWLYLDRYIWSKLVTLVSILLVVMQIAPTVGILAGAYDESDREYNTQLTTSGMFEYSQDGNVFVFVLDRLDFTYIEKVMAQDEDFFDRLDGFTGYDNVSSSYTRTEPALAHMLTGCEELAHYVPEKDYFRDAWFEDGKDILRDISAQDFSIELYTKKSVLFSDSEYCAKYVDNAFTPNSELIYGEVFKKLMRLSAYRYSPIFGKPFFWQDTNYFNTDVFKTTTYGNYNFEDHIHGPKFATATADRKEKAFKFYHLNGPHAPYHLTADGKYSEGRTSMEEQLMGCMKYLYDAFDRMKELGIYEDATIIITADHGDAIDDFAPMQAPMRIGLFYKPSGSAGTPLTWSSAPLSSDNLAATFVKCVGGDYSLYGTPIDEVAEDAEVVRYFYKCVCDDSHAEREICVYEITGHAKDEKNWKLIKRENIDYPFYGK